MNVTFFQTIGGIVESIFTTIQNASLNEKFIQLQAVFSILVTLSIMYKGYETLAGRSQDPVRELIWDIARKLFILTFVLNINGWLSSAISALDAIYAWAGGGTQFYSRLDGVTGSFLDTLNKVWKSYGGITGTIQAIFICFFMIASFLAVIITFAFTIISASITNTFLIIALPLALFCFMYQSTRNVFVQWCNMFISNIFLLIFMTCFIDFLINNLNALYASTQETSNFFIQIMQTILIGGILIACISVIKELAKNLANVSIDSAGSSALNSMSSSVGKVSGSVSKSTGKAGLGVLSGSAAKAEKLGGLSGLAGYGIKKGVVSGFKKLLGNARNGA
ncbi:MAG TPA: type IV secretion system protein [Campylobacter avium]|uniref:type IV secretion system protein n=1 Tax=Campylobacter avium TaxID=522485 RepID=UPI001DDBB8F2|nr:type IV secretion system protein [Campylobacter avium]HJE66783.1 type IV secretion system protein [Campylobacter avium]